MAKIRPFLKWAGGKYNCLEKILPTFPPGTRLIEPFGGSGVVFMNTSFSSYLICEGNRDLIELFNTLKQEGQSFINYCQQFFVAETNTREKYYEIRAEFNELTYSPKKSALFLYLNRHGYNGLCRYNSKGIFNVPFGLYSKPYFPKEQMLQFHKKSHEAEFIHNDFRQTFELAQPGDIIYCDPPYVPLSDITKAFAYTSEGFNEEDQIQLTQLAEETAARGIPVIISNHDLPFTRQQYHKAQIKSFRVARWINCQGDRRQPVNELVALFT